MHTYTLLIYNAYDFISVSTATYVIIISSLLLSLYYCIIYFIIYTIMYIIHQFRFNEVVVFVIVQDTLKNANMSANMCIYNNLSHIYLIAMYPIFCSILFLI